MPAVCFDLDRTLCVDDQDREAVLRAAFDRAGVEPYCTSADLSAATQRIPTAETDLEFYRLCFAEAARELGADPTHAPDLARAYDAVQDHGEVRPLPGVEAALDAAREVGPVALVTNGSETIQTAKLETLGLADAFDATVFCDPAAGVPPKPDAAPFERALATLGTDPAETYHVGDSLAADVAGANAMGMRSVWVPHDDAAADNADHEPSHTVDSLADLPAVLGADRSSR